MLGKLIGERRRKLEKIREAGHEPYPIQSHRNFAAGDALARFAAIGKKKTLTLAGRVRSFRDQGGVVFLDVDDGTGVIQVVAMKKETHHFDFWKGVIDAGDFIEARGTLFETKRGEKSVKAVKLRVIAKSLRPIPSEWYGLKDEEEKLRRRYLDMLLDKEVKMTIEKRSEVVRRMREFLWNEGFLEVETPMLHPIPGGALARPFVTHHNALKQDFYLRIAPELYLKRLLVGGFNKVFEIGRVFRNEGIDRDHNPEFTMLELYLAYADAKDMVRFTKKLLAPFIKGPWKEMRYEEAMNTYAGRKVDIAKTKGAVLDDLFKRKVRPNLTKPTILVDYPKSISPLAKSKEDNPDITDRFQFVVDGTEVANGFSELNDPIDQRERMEEQERLYRQGDKEATRLDEEFLTALEYGMPPAAGLGVGVDRVAAIAAGKHSVKDVIIFPTLRRKKTK